MRKKRTRRLPAVTAGREAAAGLARCLPAAVLSVIDFARVWVALLFFFFPPALIFILARAPRASRKPVGLIGAGRVRLYLLF